VVQQVIQFQDLSPVSVLCLDRIVVDRGDRRLQLVGQRGIGQPRGHRRRCVHLQWRSRRPGRVFAAAQSDGVSPLTWYLIIANASLWIVWGIAPHDYVAGIPSLITLPAASIVVARSPEQKRSPSCLKSTHS